MKKPKYVIGKLTLDEVSGVTIPAQAHALVAIMKNDDSQCGDDDLKVNDSNLEKSEMSEVELKKQVEELEMLLKMSDAERAHLATLDKEAGDKFKALDAEARAKLLKKSAEDDEIIKSGDTEIKKSVVGDAAFAILKAQELRIVEAEERIAKAEKDAETVTLMKRADDDFKHLPGEAVAKAAVLRHAAKMPEDVRKTFEDILKAADAALAPAFQTLGRQGGKVDIAKSDELARKTTEYAKAHSVTDAVAQIAVLKAHPELYEG